MVDSLGEKLFADVQSCFISQLQIQSWQCKLSLHCTATAIYKPDATMVHSGSNLAALSPLMYVWSNESDILGY